MSNKKRIITQEEALTAISKFDPSGMDGLGVWFSVKKIAEAALKQEPINLDNPIGYWQEGAEE